MSVLRLTPEQYAAKQARAKRAPAALDRPVSDAKPVKAPKYKNKVEGGYASRKESKRAAELRALEAAGQIVDLREQVKFVLIPKQEGERECSYIADFVYRSRDGYVVVEDCKGYRTAIYRIKRKLMLRVHGIRIRET